MTTMMLIPEVEPAHVLIEQGHPEHDAAAEALWKTTGVRPRTQGDPTVRLVACDSRTHEFLGVADYFRTFPPEDALGAVAVVPEQRHRGIGADLLRALARTALRNGKRNLAGFMREDDVAAWHLLRAAAIPVRLYNVQGGLYYELDLVPLLRREASDASPYGAPLPRRETSI